MAMNDRHILIIEDNPDDERLILQALEHAGVTVAQTVVSDGQEACEYLFAEDTVLHDMVLLVLKLPKVDGFDVVGRIRGGDKTKHLRVVIFTSASESGDVVRSYE